MENQPESTTPIHCPVQSVYDITPCPPEEVEPLLDHLRENRATTGSQAFPRGTTLEDGRLDLCKQSLGPENCRLITQALERNTQVRSLLLGTDGIGDTGARDVARLVAQNDTLEIVYLGCNRISAEGTGALADALRDNGSVKGLWLKRNPIGKEGAFHLASLLRENTTLTTLDLVNTGIGSEGLAAVLEALTESNRTLTRLYLGGNGLGPADARLLANLLQANPTITALLLNVNLLGDDGAQALAEGLRENQTLTELGIASCGITPVGAQPLFDTIAHHPTLEDLDFGYSPSTKVLGASANCLSDHGGEIVGGCLASDPVLQRLDLRRAGMNAIDRERVADAVELNTHLVELRLDGPKIPRIAARLLENRAGMGLPLTGTTRPDPDVALIRSVYRTATKPPQ